MRTTATTSARSSGSSSRPRSPRRATATASAHPPARRTRTPAATAPSRARQATPREFERLENAIYSPEKHASLQTDDDVLFQLTGILTAAEFDPANWRAGVPKIGLSMDVEDTVGPADADPRPGCSRRAILEARWSRSSRTWRPERRPRGGNWRTGDDGWYTAELGPFPEGVYRVCALGTGVEPVTDLVTVIAEE